MPCDLLTFAITPDQFAALPEGRKPKGGGE